jgi:DNA-binding XRE family transcriptional regulator
MTERTNSQKLKDFLFINRMTQEEFAGRLGVCRHTIIRVLKTNKCSSKIVSKSIETITKGKVKSDGWLQ